ncbi:MAG TPA: cupin domain-containing protein [Blastocatellia bacterium]|nr:cupin domain-containing protein [Blastocatellia bacterium]
MVRFDVGGVEDWIIAMNESNEQENNFRTAADVAIDVVIRRFDSPDETRVMEKGKFEIVNLGGLVIGRATYEPGWKWSEHVGPGVGATRCSVEHVGLVMSGCATAALDDGRVFELREGEMFYIPPVPHDSWVVGNEVYVSLHFLGAERYAK